MVPTGLAKSDDCPVFKERERPTSSEQLSPIALTSTIGKLLEQLIVNRHSWWLEAKSLPSPWQSGSASADEPPTNASDCPSSFAMAFSRQIRNEPSLCSSIILRYTTMSGEPVCYRRCLISESRCISCSGRRHGLLTALLASNSTGYGRCRTSKEGLPQDSILSPLLFVLYINDLLGNFSESTMVSSYADDLAQACRDRKNENVALRMQAEVDKVVSWSQQARLTLNAAKCEVAFISLDNAEAQWRPQITINGVPPSCTPSPTFLGVTYDRRMTFGTQIKNVCQQMLRRTNLLRVVGGSTWGWQKQDLRTVNIATQRSVAEYAAAAWTPWLSSSNIEKLERTQLQATRAITHHVRSTPTEAV